MIDDLPAAIAELPNEAVACITTTWALAYLTREANFTRRKFESQGKKIRADEELPTLVVVRADYATPFDLLNKVLTECQKHGFRKFALRAMNKGQEAKS
jgi:biopolymer transport protein ExbD